MTQEKTGYEKFYSGFMEKIPEKYAKKICINFLRVPFDLLGTFEIKDERLKTSIGDCELSNPVILSACYHEPHVIRRAEKLGFGAVTLKVTEDPRAGNKEPVIVRRGNGFVNCVGFKNPGMVECGVFLKNYERKKPIILNITGGSIDEYLKVISYLDKYADMIELNISCPNTKTGLNFSQRPTMTKDLFAECRKATNRPLIVKLSPNKEVESGNYETILPNAADSGIDAVNYGNTRSVGEPRLSVGRGGLSGSELYDNMIRNVESIHEDFGGDLDIIATGGIDSPEGAYKAISRGAKCVSYMTAFVTKGPFLAKRINSYLMENHD